MEIREVFTPAAIAAYWTDAYSNSIPYLGRGLFPVRKQAGLELAWFKGAGGLPVSLMPSAFDAKATFRDRIGFEKIETEMPFFREGYLIKEIDRQRLMSYEKSDNRFARDIITRIFDGASDLISGADVVPERMIWQLLFPTDGNAGISIVANGVDYTYNYDTDGSWKESNYIVLTTTGLWSASDTADPFVDIDNAKQVVQDKTGATITRAIMNSVTFNMLAKIKAVQNRFLTLNGAAIGYLRASDVKSVFKDANDIDFIVYDKKYRDEKKATHKYIPDGYVAFIPDGPLGETVYGTTPEEADLRGSSANATVAVVNEGVAITHVYEPHPVSHSIFASEIVLPTFTAMDDVVTMKVIA